MWCVYIDIVSLVALCFTVEYQVTNQTKPLGTYKWKKRSIDLENINLVLSHMWDELFKTGKRSKCTMSVCIWLVLLLPLQIRYVRNTHYYKLQENISFIMNHSVKKNDRNLCIVYKLMAKNSQNSSNDNASKIIFLMPGAWCSSLSLWFLRLVKEGNFSLLFSLFDSMDPYNQTVNFELKMFYHKDNMRRPSLLLLVVIAPYAFVVNCHLISCSCTSLDVVCKFLSLTHRYIGFWQWYFFFCLFNTQSHNSIQKPSQIRCIVSNLKAFASPSCVDFRAFRDLWKCLFEQKCQNNNLSLSISHLSNLEITVTRASSVQCTYRIYDDCDCDCVSCTTVFRAQNVVFVYQLNVFFSSDDFDNCLFPFSPLQNSNAPCVFLYMYLI